MMEKSKKSNMKASLLFTFNVGHKCEVYAEKNTNENRGGSRLDGVVSNSPSESSEKHSVSGNQMNQEHGPWMVVNRRGKGRFHKESEILRGSNLAPNSNIQGGQDLMFLIMKLWERILCLGVFADKIL